MAKKNNSKVYIENWAEGCDIRPCVADYITIVSKILHRDYCTLECGQFDNIYAWDADGYEQKRHGNQSSETVDMVLGLDYGKMLMVECKLRVRNVDKLKGEIEAKINHTREYIVSSTNFISIIQPSIVLFAPKNFQVLYSRFRKFNNNKTNIKPMTLDGFYKEFYETA